MEQETLHDDPVAASTTTAQESGLLESSVALFSELRGLVHDHLQLATLEAKYACESLITMLVAGIVAAILCVSAWLGLMAAGALFLVELGLVSSAAILIMVGVNLLAVAVLYYVIRRKSQTLHFEKTLNSLRQAKFALTRTPPI